MKKHETLLQEEMVDVQEIAKELEKLPDAEKVKILYMIKGAQLIEENKIIRAAM